MILMKLDLSNDSDGIALPFFQKFHPKKEKTALGTVSSSWMSSAATSAATSQLSPDLHFRLVSLEVFMF